MYDILKLFSIQQLKRKSMFIQALLFVFSILFLILFHIYSQNSVITHEPAVTYHYGIKAIRENISQEKIISGKLSEDKLLTAFDKYQEFSLKKNKKEIDYKNIDKFASLYDLLSMASPNYIDELKKGRHISLFEVNRDSIKDYYTSLNKNRIKYYQEILKTPPDKMNHLTKKANQINTPFYFETYKGLNTFIQNYDVFLLVVFFNIILFASTAFSSLNKYNEKSIVRTTKYGRKHLNTVIIFLYNMISVLSYTIAFCIIYFTSKSLLDRNVTNTSIQLLYSLSPAPDTIGTYLLKMYIVGLFSTIGITNLTIYLSSKIDNRIYILLGMTILLIFPKIVSLFYLGNIFIDQILTILSPANGLMLYREYVVDYSLIGRSFFILPTYLVMIIWNSIFSAFLSYKNYRNI